MNSFPQGRKAHIISHIHWDREWYLPFRFFQVELPEFFSALFTLLTKRETQSFVLDGATVMIEDWQTELQRKGEKGSKLLKQLRKLVREGRVLVGPYYVQLDWYLANGETLVRNLLIGTQEAETLGQTMKVGWLMDNFGLPAQTPQIHQQSDVQTLFVWRGIYVGKRQCELRMVGSNGDEILVMYMRDSYRNAMQLMASDPKKRIQAACSSLLPHSESKQVLLMNGYDHDLFVEDLSSVIDTNVSGITVCQSTPAAYAEAVSEALGAKGPTEAVVGEHICGWDVAVFPGIHSARVPLKQQSAYCEYLLQRIAEPMAVLAGMPSINFKKFWKKLLQNHPHDSISGVSVDPVHSAMKDNFSKLERSLHAQIGKIASNIVSDTGVYLFNPSPFVRSETVKLPKTRQQKGGTTQARYQRVNLPPLSLTPLRDSIQEGGQNALEPLVVQKRKRVVHNAFIKLSIADDGSLSVYDRLSDKHYSNMHVFKDNADAGDCYNYSPCKYDEQVTTEQNMATISFLTKTAQLVRISIQQILRVPDSVEGEARSSTSTEIPIISYVTLTQDSPIIRFETYIRNRARDHRLSLYFNTGTSTDTHYAGAPFEAVCRKNGPRKVMPDKDGVSSLSVTAREVEDYGDYPFEGWVAPSGDAGMLCMARGLREYQSYGNGDVAIHLFRSVGWIAQSNLISRSGDAGPEIRVPDAWLLEDLRFEYAICPFSKGWQERYREIDAYLNPLYIFQAEDKHPHTKNTQAKGHASSFESERLGKALVTLDSEGEHQDNDKTNENPIFISACKHPEQSRVSQAGGVADKAADTFILRVYNPCETSTNITVSSTASIVHAVSTNLLEQRKEEYTATDKALTILLGAKEIKSVMLTLNRNGKNKKSPGTYTIRQYSEQSRVPRLLKQYAIPAAYTQELLRQELASVQQIKQELDTIEKPSGMEKGLHGSLVDQRRTLLERSLLEKELSTLLIRHRIEHPEDFIALTKVESTLYGLGKELNKARINKRVADFQVLMAED